MAKWTKDIVVAEITAALMEAANAECAAEVERIQADLSTPYPPASSPGEPPAMRTGALRSSIDYMLTAGDSGINITFTAGVPYADYLEAMNRLVLGHVESRADDLIDRIVGKI